MTAPFSQRTVSRRTLLKAMASVPTLSLPTLLPAQTPELSLTIPDATPQQLAVDESFWRTVANYYDRTEGVINLEHGYWGKMARPVQTAYLEATRFVNAQNSFYARKQYGADLQISVARVADALGAQPDEIVLTRNATEAIHNLLRQYQGLQAGDGILLADVDYPSFKTTVRWLADERQLQTVEVQLPWRASQQEILDRYVQAFEAHPNLKLMLLTHVSNQHGLTLPVAAIAEQAKSRGIDVICDSAQSWGLLDFNINDLNVDWAGFNLHKWLGSPVGVGALYMRRGSLAKIAPYPGEEDPENTRAATSIHTATSNFAAMMVVPEAIAFHQKLGPANKEARLRYLRAAWTAPAEQMPHIEVLGGKDEQSWSGMGAFRLRGQSSAAEVNQLQQRLENEFGIFTVGRFGLADGACIRITPQVFTSLEEVQQLVAALEQLA